MPPPSKVKFETADALPAIWTNHCSLSNTVDILQTKFKSIFMNENV